MSPDRLLLASVHDVSPRFEAEVDHLIGRLRPALDGQLPALLVVPDFWNEAPIASNSAFQARLRRWSDEGAEIFLHGWSHKDESAPSSRGSAWKARYMTAGEGEFLGLGRDEAARRLRSGRSLLEDITGRAVAGFIAPAWLYGPGSLQALEEEQFALAEDHWRIWSPASARRLARSPVVTWASRSPARLASSLAFAAVAPPILRPLQVVRLAVHPGDVTKPSLLASIQRTLGRLRKTRRPSRYDELLQGNA